MFFKDERDARVHVWVMMRYGVTLAMTPEVKRARQQEADELARELWPDDLKKQYGGGK